MNHGLFTKSQSIVLPCILLCKLMNRFQNQYIGFYEDLYQEMTNGVLATQKNISLDNRSPDLSLLNSNAKKIIKRA